MKNFVQPVNVEALKTATEAVVGQEVTDTIVRVYKAIDQAMFAATSWARKTPRLRSMIVSTVRSTQASPKARRSALRGPSLRPSSRT
jgi:acyl-CoA reductase-like NAD-dependent aldehyde dehydrogenase